MGFLADTSLTAPWITASFPVIRIILVILMALCSLAMIVSILMQSHTSNDISAVNGQESYYAENKGQSRDGRLKKITIAMASTIFAVIVLYFISILIYPAI